MAGDKVRSASLDFRFRPLASDNVPLDLSVHVIAMISDNAIPIVKVDVQSVGEQVTTSILASYDSEQVKINPTIVRAKVAGQLRSAINALYPDIPIQDIRTEVTPSKPGETR